MITFKPVIYFAIISAASLACSGQAANNASTRSGQTPPASAPAPAPAHGAAPAQADAQSVSGTVVETMDAASYTYVRVKTASGEIWAASTQFPVAVGDRVTVPLESPMQNFHSQSLKRDFPLIYFASRITKEGEPAPGGAAQSTAPAGDPHGAAAGPQPTAVTEPIAPPQGGTTIAKVWADRKALAGKEVTVRGKVVKYNEGIMGRNWIHIQDGSGKAADGSNDLLLTTNEAAKVGDVVTAAGTVALDKDFGAGYRYTVMLENAKIK